MKRGVGRWPVVRRRAKCVGTVTASLLLLFCEVAFALPAVTPVLVTSRWEGLPTGHGEWFVWVEEAGKEEGHFDTFARLGDGSRFKVNAPGTSAWGGGVWGNTLVYQVVRRGNRELVFYDLERRRSFPVPSGVNTKFNETFPSVSENWLFFSRNNVGISKPKWQRLILLNLDSGETRTVAKSTPRGRQWLFMGQVAGNYAEWDDCVFRHCRVVRYDISTGAYEYVEPASDAEWVYAGSIAANGDLFYARATYCNYTPAIIYRRTLAGVETPIASVPLGWDAWTASLAPTLAGGATLYLQVTPCGDWTFKDSDVYSIPNTL